METLHPQPPSVPHTPPYTPYRGKRRLERSDSPASSIHPTETVSPAKKAQKRHPAEEDNVKVEELVEGDVGYYTDIEVVYPDELEEAQSTDNNGDTSADEAEDDAETRLNKRLSRLNCDEDAEAEFEKERRKRHFHRRTGSRIYKRSHSQSIKSDTDVTDPDAMGDHDLTKSQRRLRRRVQGPEEVVGEEVRWSSPDVATSPLRGPSRATSAADLQRLRRHVEIEDVMDVDEGM